MIEPYEKKNQARFAYLSYRDFIEALFYPILNGEAIKTTVPMFASRPAAPSLSLVRHW